MVDACDQLFSFVSLFTSSNVGSVLVKSKRRILSIEAFGSKTKYKVKPPCMITSLGAKTDRAYLEQFTF